MRRIKVHTGKNLLWLKMRPDTPQHYEYISVENVEGKITNFININPWTQFFDLKGRTDKPISAVDHISIQNCLCSCEYFFNVSRDEQQYTLTNFSLQNLDIQTLNKGSDYNVVNGISVDNVKVEVIKSLQ